jgi:hypothetical protein
MFIYTYGQRRLPCFGHFWTRTCMVVVLRCSVFLGVQQRGRQRKIAVHARAWPDRNVSTGDTPYEPRSHRHRVALSCNSRHMNEAAIRHRAALSLALGARRTATTWLTIVHLRFGPAHLLHVRLRQPAVDAAPPPCCPLAAGPPSPPRTF